MRLFDFINLVFTRPSAARALDAEVKRNQFFMLNRFLAKQHPYLAARLSIITIDPAKAVDFWINWIEKAYTRVPDWIRAPAAKVESEIDYQTRAWIKNKYQLGSADFRVALQLFPNAIETAINLKKIEDKNVTNKGN
jgi:hypothetical protein